MALTGNEFRLCTGRLALAVAVALGGMGVACGGDDDDDDTAAAETAETDTAEPGSGSTEALCAVEAKIDTPFDEAGQYASREQKQAAAQAVVDGGFLDEATAAAPAGLAAAVETRVAAIRSAAGGMTEALISTEAIDAAQVIDDACTGGTGGY